MIKKKSFDYSAKSLDFGFEYYSSRDTAITINQFSKMTSTSLFIYDTENCIIEELLRNNSELVNDAHRLFIGLVSDKILESLQKLGVKTGIFRSTNIKNNCAVIVVDKTKVFIAMDEKHIYEVNTSYSREIFQYLNYLFWSQTDFEFFGNYGKVKDLRMSVLEPNLSPLMNENVSSAEYGTEDYQANNMMINSEHFTKRKSYLLACPISNAFSKSGNDLNINVFGNVFLPIPFERETLFNGESFHNKTLKDLIQKEVWYREKKYKVQSEKTISEDVYLTLDEFNDYIPDFEKVAERNNELVCTLNVEVNVKKVALDDTYKRHPNYKEKEKAENELNSSIQKIENLKIDGIEKQLSTVIGTKNLSEKIRLFNELLNKYSDKIGDEVLNKKEKLVSPIVVSQEKIAVPSDVIGDLYIKDGKAYIAVDSSSNYQDAKQWLNDHKMEGFVILKNAENN